jgi:glycosyltransferase involved in cell wall biosynthesis
MIDYAARYSHLVAQTRYSVKTGQPEWSLRSGFEAGVCAWTKLIGQRWADDDLEALIMQAGREIVAHNPPKEYPPLPVDVLGLASTLCDFGGHTVMLRHWMRTLRDAGMSVATLSTFINPGDAAPLAIEDLKTLGPVELLPSNAPLSARLLLLASKLKQYRPKVIVMAINPQDVMVLGALSAVEHGPTVFLDHADHVQWLGKAISDVVVEYRQQGMDNAVQRGIVPDKLRVVPLLCGYEGAGKKLGNIRAQYHIPPHAPLSLTVATVYKLLNAKTWDYMDTMVEMLKRNSQQHHLLVVNADAEGFRLRVPREQVSRFHITGPVAHGDLESFYRQSDFLIESWPFPGSTVRYEALSLGLPIIPVDSGDNPQDIELMGLPEYAHICRERAEFNTAVWDLVSNLELRLAYGEQSVCFFMERFSREKVEAQIVACVKERML